MKQLFPKTFRIIKRKDFLTTTKKNSRLHGQFIHICQRPNDLSYSKLGITVSKKMGKATIRNRYKRIIREAFRLNYTYLPKGFNIVIFPTKKTIFAKSFDIAKDLKKLLLKKNDLTS